MTDLGHGKDLKFVKTIDPSTPLAYSSTPVLTPGSNQLADVLYVDEKVHPTLEPVKDFVDFVTSEPASPAIGDRNINTTTGTSSITTQLVTATYLYEWNGSTWTEFVPVAADRVYDETSQKFYIYTGSQWIVDHESLPQLQTYYIGKAGNDANSGLSVEDPILTIGQAITLATAQTPSSSNRFRLQVIDGGVYDLGTSNLILPSWCYFNAPGATITATTGSFSVSDNSFAVFGNVIKTGGGFMLQKTAGSGNGFITILGDADMGAHGFINYDNGNLHIKFNRSTTTGSVPMVQGINGSLFLEGDYLNNSGAAVSRVFLISGTGKLYAKVKSINGADIAVATLNTATAYVQAEEISGVYSLAATSTYDIQAGDTRRRNSAMNFITAGTNSNINFNPSGNVAFNGNAIGTADIKGKGDITGMVVKYNSTTSITITAGAMEMNGNLYILSNDTTHTMTSTTASFDIHYIYVTVGTPPNVSIIDSISEPIWSNSKRGFYNGNDKCISAVISRSGTTNIDYFSVAPQSDHFIRVHYGRASLLQLATNMNPTSAWQTPNTNESSVTLPVTSTAVKLWLSNTDVDAVVTLAATSSEMAAVNTALADGEVYYTASIELILSDGWVNLGASRNVRIGGANDDDNFLSSWVTGFEIQR
jgi:hypothetical protein